jgi:hypothetical protein
MDYRRGVGSFLVNLVLVPLGFDTRQLIYVNRKFEIPGPWFAELKNPHASITRIAAETISGPIPSPSRTPNLVID